MNKIETSKLLNKIKGYYNNQFFVDEYVIDAWVESLKPYEYVDAEDHLKQYLKDYPETPPKPHIFKKGLYTREEKEQMKNNNYTIQCNLCGRWMNLINYDRHYDKCLDIQYLVDIAKQKGEQYTREDLENCKKGIIEKLLEKYPPKEVVIENLGDIFK